MKCRIVDFKPHNYRGEYLRSCMYTPNNFVTATMEKSVNYGVYIINLYLNHKRVRGMRINKNDFTMLRVQDFMNAIYWEYIFK